MGTRLLIIGAVAGGASAAARARRIDEHADIILFERGPYVSFANCGLPYYIGREIKKRGDLLVATPDMFKNRFNIDVRTQTEVIGINREEKNVAVRNLSNAEEYTEKYDRLILSPGAAPVRPPIPGADLDSVMTIRNIPDTDNLRKKLKKKSIESAVVVGGGYIGLEMAENLVRLGLKVTIVEMLDQVMAPIDPEMAEFIHDKLRENGVDVRLSEKVEAIRKENDLTIVTTSGGEISAGVVIMSVGVRPETELAKKAGLEIGPAGGIKTDETLRTSDPDIFAVGDAAEVIEFVSGAPALIPLAGPANRQGRIAADNALGRNVVYTGALGTSVLKLFDMTVACTGNNEKALKRRGVDYETSYTHSGSHADYYPGAEAMAIKLLFGRGDGRILGAQIIGGAGVDKRIDVIATAIRARMTVFDLEELDLAYAPPYSSAKDPVNMAGFVAANILKGDVKKAGWNEVEELVATGHVMLDVRNAVELEETGRIKDALNIPLNELRKRLNELDKNTTYIIYCTVGMRSYIAHRILAQNGYKSKNLSGGITTYKTASKRLS